MTNVINFNDRTFQNVSVAVMNDILDSDVSGTCMDDVYRTVCRYVSVSRKKFEECYRQAEEKLLSWQNGGVLSNGSFELNEEDLDMVVGGSARSFFRSIGRGLANAGRAAGNFVKEHGPAIGLAVGAVIALTGVGAILGAGAFGVAAVAAGLTFAEGASTGILLGGAFVGACSAVGATVGVLLDANR